MKAMRMPIDLNRVFTDNGQGFDPDVSFKEKSVRFEDRGPSQNFDWTYKKTTRLKTQKLKPKSSRKRQIFTIGSS